ncbi:MAG: hypothetical protein KatS3mg003_2260 [Candidatus Nitrosocaldaceae archaeon]|nr:MAG: hypothetical protein KatS3mg003_2260 [Candidatus Nitrosocaldaceae archaeon]
MNIIEELKGIIKTRKSWGRLKNEYYEQKKPFIK